MSVVAELTARIDGLAEERRVLLLRLSRMDAYDGDRERERLRYQAMGEELESLWLERRRVQAQIANPERPTKPARDVLVSDEVRARKAQGALRGAYRTATKQQKIAAIQRAGGGDLLRRRPTASFPPRR
jgi:hypothetical protein